MYQTKEVEECIKKDILADILIKNRGEVEDMFLTTFDKKMYEEAVRLDARAEVEAEMNERCEKLSRSSAQKSLRRFIESRELF